MRQTLLLVISFSLFLCGCGVRGRPTPPDRPSMIGRGEPSFSKATEKVTVPSKKNKNNNSDWNDPDDFQEGER